MLNKLMIILSRLFEYNLKDQHQGTTLKLPSSIFWLIFMITNHPHKYHVVRALIVHLFVKIIHIVLSDLTVGSCHSKVPQENVWLSCSRQLENLHVCYNICNVLVVYIYNIYTTSIILYSNLFKYMASYSCLIF